MLIPICGKTSSVLRVAPDACPAAVNTWVVHNGPPPFAACSSPTDSIKIRVSPVGSSKSLMSLRQKEKGLLVEIFFLQGFNHVRVSLILVEPLGNVDSIFLFSISCCTLALPYVRRVAVTLLPVPRLVFTATLSHCQPRILVNILIRPYPPLIPVHPPPKYIHSSYN